VPTNKPDSRKTHIIRIFGTNQNGDLLSDIWADLERIDQAHVTSQSPESQWQGIVEKFRWVDDPNANDYNPDGNQSRKQVLVKLCSPDEPDQSNPAEWIPIQVVKSMRTLENDNVIQGQWGAVTLHKNDDPNLDVTNTRKVSVRKISHYDTNIDDDAQAAATNGNTAYVVSSDQYTKDLTTKDDSQFVNHEVILAYKSRNSGDSRTGSGDDQGMQVKLKNQYLIDDSDDPDSDAIVGDNNFNPPWRLDPYQNIVNVQLGGATEFEVDSNMSLDTPASNTLSISISMFIVPTQEAIDNNATIYEFGFEGTSNTGSHPGLSSSSITLNPDGTVTFNFASPKFPPNFNPDYYSDGGTFPYGYEGDGPPGGAGGGGPLVGIIAEGSPYPAGFDETFTYVIVALNPGGAGFFHFTNHDQNFIISSTSTGKVVAGKWNHIMVAAKFSLASVTTSGNPEGDPTADPPVPPTPLTTNIDSAPIIIARVNDVLDTDNTSIDLLQISQPQDVPAGSVLPSLQLDDGTIGNVRWLQNTRDGSPVTTTVTMDGSDPQIYLGGHVGVPVPEWDIESQTHVLAYAGLQVRKQFIDPTIRDNVDNFMKVNPDPKPDNSDLYMLVSLSVPRKNFGDALFDQDGTPTRFVKNNGTGGGPFVPEGKLKVHKYPKRAPIT
jgi:hypothetical protein